MKVTQRERERGDWCSLCLMYSSARSLALGTEIVAGRVSAADLQRCLGHPEIHYRSVGGAHLDAALQQQITANDLLLPSSLPTTLFFFLENVSSFLCSSLSLSHLFVFFQSASGIKHLFFHSIQHVKYWHSCWVSQCKVKMFNSDTPLASFHW